MLSLFLFLIGCSRNERKEAGKSHDKFTCPMHPEVIKNEPGSCPICGMDLVKVHEGKPSQPGGEERQPGEEDTLSMLLKRPDEYVVSSIRTVRLQRETHPEELLFNGVISYNTRSFRSVSARVGGRIERLFVKYNYQQVKKGQKLMEVYSPDLSSAQQELLFLRNSGDEGLFQRAKQKLHLLGASDRLISEVIREGRMRDRFSIYSPYSGYVVEISNNSAQAIPAGTSGAGSAVTASASGGMSAGMAGTAPTNPDATSPSGSSVPMTISEGQYIGAGQTVLRVVDDASLWAEFSVRPEFLPALKKGMSVDVDAVGQPGLQSTARIELVQPYYKDGATFSLVRAVVHNKERRWKVGQIVSVRHTSGKKEGYWLPKTAVLDLGQQYVVFVKRNGAFVPRAVRISGRAGDLLNVKSGIGLNDEVAENAWFLVDSESFVRLRNEQR